MIENVTDYWGYDVYDQDTIFDRLSAKSIPWRIYVGDIPQSILLLNQVKKGNISNYRLFGQFEADIGRECENFPAYVFIEPSYEVIGNDDHPPHDVHAGQNLIATVYNAIRSNDRLWRETLLVVTYDEHGGFYDHVPPPAATHPGGIDMKEWTFDSLGLRVPAILISPYVKQGVFSEQLEHSSLPRFLIERFELERLTERTRTAGSFASAITGHYRDNTPERLPLGSFNHRIKLTALNELQKALVRAGEWAQALFNERKYLPISYGQDTDVVERLYTAEDYERASAGVAEMLSRNT
jgi:phospholipase C